MEKSNVAEVLRALASGDKARSETARLRDVFDEVEAALQAGVSRAAILESLQSQGFTMQLKGFESALYRIRKNRNKQPGGAAPAGSAATPKHTVSLPSNESEAVKTTAPESSDQPEVNRFEQVKAALSNEDREADIKQYEKSKVRLKDKLSKQGEAK